MARLLSGLLSLVLFLGCVPTAGAVGTSASSAILLDAGSGRVLYEQNADERRPIASITKMMTALLTVEHWSDLDTQVKILPEHIGAEGSSMYLRAGEVLTVRELLYGLLLNSGNDAAVALACLAAGSVEEFARWMNERAAQLGMVNTHFVNPNGLSAEGHYSSARDMALLTAECLMQEDLVTILSTKSITIGSRTMTNHNKLLWEYDGCIGGKTGYTMLAGRTLISCAQRDGQVLVAVTLNDGNDWADHKALLDYGFSQYPAQTLLQKGDVVMDLPVTASLTRFVPVVAAADVRYPLGEGEQVSTEYNLPESMEAPLEEGQKVGRITYYLNGVEIAAADLICGEKAEWELVKGSPIRSLIERLTG